MMNVGSRNIRNSIVLVKFFYTFYVSHVRDVKTRLGDIGSLPILRGV